MLIFLFLKPCNGIHITDGRMGNAQNILCYQLFSVKNKKSLNPNLYFKILPTLSSDILAIHFWMIGRLGASFPGASF